MAGRQDAFAAGHGGAGTGANDSDATGGRPIEPSATADAEQGSNQGQNAGPYTPKRNSEGNLINQDPNSEHFGLELPADRSAPQWENHVGHVPAVASLGRSRKMMPDAASLSGERPKIPHLSYDPRDGTSVALTEKQLQENKEAETAQRMWDKLNAGKSGPTRQTPKDESIKEQLDTPTNELIKSNTVLLREARAHGTKLMDLHRQVQARMQALPDEHPFKQLGSALSRLALAKLGESTAHFSSADSAFTDQEQRTHLDNGLKALGDAHDALNQPIFDHELPFRRSEIDDNIKINRAQYNKRKPTVRLPKRGKFAGMDIDYSDPLVAEMAKKAQELVDQGAPGISQAAADKLSAKTAKRKQKREVEYERHPYTGDILLDGQGNPIIKQTADPKKASDEGTMPTNIEKTVTGLGAGVTSAPGKTIEDKDPDNPLKGTEDLAPSPDQPKYRIDQKATDAANSFKPITLTPEMLQKAKQEREAREAMAEKTRKNSTPGKKLRKQVRAELDAENNPKKSKAKTPQDVDTVETRQATPEELAAKIAEMKSRKPQVDIAPASRRAALFKDATTPLTSKKSDEEDEEDEGDASAAAGTAPKSPIKPSPTIESKLRELRNKGR